MTTATTSLIVTGVAGDHVYVCSYAVRVSATTNVKFVVGRWGIGIDPYCHL